MVAGQLPVFVLPILASALFPPAQVGYATIAMMISGAFSAVSAVVSNALLAHCADRPEHLRTEVGRAVRLIGVLLLAPVVITCLLASKVLGLFGADYANYSTLLVLLLVATVPNTLTDLAMASLRVQRRLVPVAAITVTGSAITTGGALLLWMLVPQWGITGAGVSALASAVIIATTLAVMLLYRNRSARAPRAPPAIHPPVSPMSHALSSPSPSPRTIRYFPLSSPSPCPRTIRLQTSRIGTDAHDIVRRCRAHAITAP